MSTYEAGFSLGERQAWEDRKAGKQPELLGRPRSDLQRGYSDGYVPRGATWWIAGQIKPDKVEQ